MIVCLPVIAWVTVVGWLFIGLCLYFAFSVRHSKAKDQPKPAPRPRHRDFMIPLPPKEEEPVRRQSQFGMVPTERGERQLSGVNALNQFIPNQRPGEFSDSAKRGPRESMFGFHELPKREMIEMPPIDYFQPMDANAKRALERERLAKLLGKEPEDLE